MSKKCKIKLILGIILLVQLITFQSIAGAQEEWSGDVSLGYNQSNGNTEKSSLSVSGQIKRMFDRAEFLIKGDIYTSSTDGRLDDQKWSGLLRTAFDIDDEGKWFFSSQLLVDHDRFSDIEVRITPSLGIGYWIAEEEDWKWNVEAQIGYESTNYRSITPDDNSMIALFRTYLEKQVFENGKISETFTFIPSLEDGGNRLKSETEFINPINDSMDFSVKFIVDHDSEPAVGKKKTDTRLVTGIKYSF